MPRVIVAALLPILLAACLYGDGAPDSLLFVNTATNLDSELEFEGAAEHVVIAPDERIWLALGGTGQIIVADSVLAPWHHVFYPPFRQNRSGTLAGWPPSIQVLSFFTTDTVIGMGLGGELYRTVDGGVRWDTVTFGAASFIDAAFTLGEGRGWIGGGGEGGSSALFATDDQGATWRALPLPFDSRVSSIYMEEPEVGIVAGLWNRLARTADGGVTWTALPTPFDQGVVPDVSGDRQHVLDAVVLVGDRMIVRQGERVFQSLRDPVVWSPLPGDIRLFAYDREEDLLYGLNGANEVLRYDADLEARSFGRESPHGFPIHMAAHGGKVVVLEREGALLEVTSTGSQYGFPLSDTSTWRMSKVRGIGDRLWGVTTHQIYTSEDMGQTWDRVGFTPTAIRSFLVRTKGDLLVWDGHGRNLTYDPEKGVLRPVESLRGYDVVDIMKFEGRWVAFGGRQYETTGRVEVGRTYYAGQFEGSRENGFVLVSQDEGERWRQVDEWRDGGVANVFVDPVSEDMVLVSYLGGVRRLTRTESGYSGIDLILPSEETWDAVPYVEVPSVLYFENERRGHIDGWIHHLGERRYTTENGGRSWREAPTMSHDVRSLPASGGYVVLRGSEMVGGVELSFLSGSTEVPIWRPEPPEQGPDDYPWAGITDFSIDDRGRLLTVLDGVEVVVLEVPEVVPPARRDPSPRR